jgi:predicted  nucleic acid-binding Zn-ribbon protein
MGIVKEARTCVDCGRTFKVESRLKVETCFGCGQVAARAAEAEHAAEMEAMPVPAWAEGDPFLNLWGTDLSVGMRNTGRH